MVPIRELICNLKAIPLWLRTREWIAHLWIEKETYPGMSIWVSKNSFRVKDISMEHFPGEHLETGVVLHGLECKHCGKKMMSWDYGNVPVLPREEDTNEQVSWSD